MEIIQVQTVCSPYISSAHEPSPSELLRFQIRHVAKISRQLALCLQSHILRSNRLRKACSGNHYFRTRNLSTRCRYRFTVFHSKFEASNADKTSQTYCHFALLSRSLRQTIVSCETFFSYLRRRHVSSTAYHNTFHQHTSHQPNAQWLAY
jgi:hypothetical protein